MPLDLDQFSADGEVSVYRKIVQHATAAHEPSSAYPDPARLAIRERLVRCFWFDQKLTTDDLRTEDGDKLRVLSPGWWNLEAGPDFRNGVIRIGRGEITKGDIEVHVYASGWEAHGHHTDPRYNSVILHAVVWNDTGRATVTRQDGVEVPMVRLEPYLEGEIGELAEMVNPEDYPQERGATVGLCHRKIVEGAVDEAWMGKFLDAAGDERLIGRARKFRARTASLPADQVLYEGIMEALGYKRNKSQFQMLASIASLERLRAACLASELDELVVQLQAVLFGVADLLPSAYGLANCDDETRQHAAPLLERWAAHRPAFAEHLMTRSQWKLSGVRPANTPPRRIAAICFILARYLRRDLLEPFRAAVQQGSTSTARGCARIRRQMQNVLAEFPDSYWSYRSGFGGKRLSKPLRLVGAPRALAIIANVIVPALMAEAHDRKQKDLDTAGRRFYAGLPRLDENNVERFMRQRLFAGDERFEGVVSSARRQQGLYQVFKDYCEQDDRGCRRCALAIALGQ